MQQQLPRIESEDLVADLIHDLRQPLDTIESSAYYLRILLAERGGAVEDGAGRHRILLQRFGSGGREPRSGPPAGSPVSCLPGR